MVKITMPNKPTDVYKNGDILTFTKTFRVGAAPYSYAAIKIGDKWYVGGHYYLWDEFLKFISIGVEKVYVVITQIEVDNLPYYKDN